MKRHLRLFPAVFAALGMCLGGTLSAAASETQKPAEKIDSRIAKITEDKEVPVIFVLKNSTPPADGKNYVRSLAKTAQESQQRLMQLLNGEKAKNIRPFFIVNSVGATVPKSTLLRAAQLPEVEKIVPDATRMMDPVRKGTETKGKVRTARSALTFSTRSSATENASARLPWNLISVSVTPELREKYSGKGVTVGIIDSGVDATHPEIAAAWRGKSADPHTSWYDPVANTPTPVDSTGHGTHVAGTILGSGIGIARGAQWIAARVFDEHGETSDSRLLQAAQWMLAPVDAAGKAHPELAPKIINSSWGGSSESQFFRPVMQQWRKAGILPVFSAGNITDYNGGGEGSIATPASFPEAFAVGALRADDRVAKFSLRGPSKFTDRKKPDISAPGVNIRSSLPGGKYGLRTGTSMAAPHVSGVAAMILQANPNLTVDRLQEIIMQTATPLTDEVYVSSPNNGYGAGKINARLAVEKALEDAGSAPAAGTVSGHVYIPGTDTEAPKIAHTALKNVYRGSETEISAEVSDDTGIKKVTVSLKFDGADK